MAAASLVGLLLVLCALSDTSAQQGTVQTDPTAVSILARVQSDDLLGASRIGGTSTVVAVGAHGAVVLYDGIGGTITTPQRSTNLPLRALAFQPGTTRALVVGGGGSAWWLAANGSLQGITSGTTMELYDVDWVSTNVAIVVGGVIPLDERPGEGLVLRFDAINGTFTQIPSPMVHNQLYRYAHSPTEDVGYAVGLDHTVLRIAEAHTQLVEHDRTTNPTEILNGVAFRNDGRPFFSGADGTVLTLDGQGRTTVVVTGTPNRLFDIVWDPTSNSGLVLADSGLILHYDGSVPNVRDVSFSVVGSHGDYSNLFTAAFGPNGAWALIVGAKGTMMRWPEQRTIAPVSPYDNTVVYLIIGVVVTALVGLVALRLMDTVRTPPPEGGMSEKRSGRSSRRAARRSGGGHGRKRP